MARELEVALDLIYNDGARSIKGPAERGIGRFTFDLSGAPTAELTQALNIAPPTKIELGEVEGQKAWIMARNLHDTDPIYLYSDDSVVQTLFCEIPPDGFVLFRLSSGLTLYGIGSANTPELKVWAVKG